MYHISWMNEWMNKWYVYQVHNLRYFYALYNNFKNTKFKTECVILNALLNRWVFNPDLKISTVLLLHWEECMLFKSSVVALLKCNSPKSDYSPLEQWANCHCHCDSHSWVFYLTVLQGKSIKTFVGKKKDCDFKARDLFDWKPVKCNAGVMYSYLAVSIISLAADFWTQ